MGSLVSDGRDPCPVITGEGPQGRGGRAERCQEGSQKRRSLQGDYANNRQRVKVREDRAVTEVRAVT